MPNLHDIERRINSVKSTMQITHTMEMVSAAKIRRATERVNDATPWTLDLSEVLLNVVAQAQTDAEPLLRAHAEVKRVLIVVVTSDRGLAGGFSSNALKAAEGIAARKRAEGAQVEIIACGKKASGYYSYRNIVPVMEFKGTSADPTIDQANMIAAYSSKGFQEGELDEAYVVFNHAKNAGEQKLIERQVLPVPSDDFAEALGLKIKGEEFKRAAVEGTVDVDFEPSAEEVMHQLALAYLRNMFYFALIDSAAAEQGARRTAMKSATDNATEMVDTLTTFYNRVRQGAITTEINEIVGGAAALEE